MKEMFGVIAGVALMVGCCLLPLVLIGAGSAGIAGILAWFGGLNPILVLAALGGGGILAYHVFRRATLGRHYERNDPSLLRRNRDGWWG